MDEKDMKEAFTNAVFEEMHKNVVLWVTFADHVGAPRKKVIRKMMWFMFKMAMFGAKTIEHTEVVNIDMEEFEKQMEELNGITGND